MADKKSKIEQWDENMKVSTVDGTPVRWYTADDKPFRLSGFYFRKPGDPFRRFPLDKQIPDAVDWLSWNTAGGQLAFKTDSAFIRIKVKLGHESLMDHCTKIGSSGFDLYWGKPGEKVFVGVTRMKVAVDGYELNLIADLPKKMREYTIHFPLYSGVDSFEIGFEPGAKLSAPSKWDDARPVVVYGTSITQGGCANRPGMAWTNILSRKFNMPFLNYGFSGSGKGEPHVFELLASIKDPSLYILDYEANAHEKLMKETLAPGLDILRAAHPKTPIMVVSEFHFNREIRDMESVVTREPSCDRTWKFEKAEVMRRRRAGDENIFFVNGAWPGMPDWHEFTVDGCHATDLGFYMFAKLLAPHIAKVLK